MGEAHGGHHYDDHCDMSSDIELLAAGSASQSRTASGASRTGVNSGQQRGGHGGGAHTTSMHMASYDDSQMDLPPPLSRSYAQTGQSSSRPAAARAPTSDIISIDSEDSDEDEMADEGLNKCGSSKWTNPSLRKTHSAPMAVFDRTAVATASTSLCVNGSETAKKSFNAYAPMSDSDDEELPDLASAASLSRKQGLKRSHSDSTTLASSKTSRNSLTADLDGSRTLSKGKHRALSPIPASSPPLRSHDMANLDHDKAEQAPRFQLMSDVDSSGDDLDKPARPAKKRKQKTKADGTSSPSKVKEPTDKQKQAAAKKAQKEAERAQKAQDKLEKAELAAMEKERKHGFMQANKIEDRQARCQEMIVDISTTLMADAAFQRNIWTTLHAGLNVLSCSHSQPGQGRKPRSGCHANLIHWRRSVTKDYIPQDRAWRQRHQDKYTVEQEKTVLVYMTGQEVERAVAARKFKGGMDDYGQELLQIVADVRKVHGADYQVFFLIHDLGAKTKSARSAENAEFQAEFQNGRPPNATARKRAAQWDDRISMQDIEQELIRLEVIGRCSVQKSDKPQMTVDWIIEFTKDIAYRPYKQIERARELYLNIDGRIESSDRGDLHKTYVNQLACINGVTDPIARAIAATYPTWRRLIQAFTSASDQKTALQGIAVLNKTNGAATNKTIGAALSERIFIVLFSNDPGLVLSGSIKEVRQRAM